MIIGSPACQPQATLAEVIKGMISSSWPIRYKPKLSPMSQLMSVLMVSSIASRVASDQWSVVSDQKKAKNL